MYTVYFLGGSIFEGVVIRFVYIYDGGNKELEQDTINHIGMSSLFPGIRGSFSK
jgi:hypothetical protein